jgi:hypothetical protein
MIVACLGSFTILVGICVWIFGGKIANRLDMGHSINDILYGKNHHKKKAVQTLLKQRRDLVAELNNQAEFNKSDVTLGRLENALRQTDEMIKSYESKIIE